MPGIPKGTNTLVASFSKYTLKFKRPSGTSRGVLDEKESYFLIIQDGDNIGIGECGLLKGLSIDHFPSYEETLSEVCHHIHLGKEALLSRLEAFPSIRFGLEQAFLSLSSEEPFELHPSDFTRSESPIPINGLVWMGDLPFMRSQVEKLLSQGYSCLKFKIGALEFEREVGLIEKIREQYPADGLEIRVDANGAFSPDEAMDKLARLAKLDLHSIEQPIKPKQLEEMARLCQQSPLPIALDEELIGVHSVTEKEKLLQTVGPQFIILKPSLLGGYSACEEWIALADQLGIGWWITSALESNIGLNAIAQWTYKLNSTMHQGLGTGSLYTNNIDSPMYISKGHLFYGSQGKWPADIKRILCI